ncbi:hypothetical protein J7I88_29210 [Paraburkholderia strydomiana]|nr:hypothetical protein [Paraburkholderia strydomiana]
MKALEPIWTTKTETATRVRGRIEPVLDWTTVSGYRSGENPARLKGHLDNLLPKRSKVQKVAHHPALPYSEVSNFIGLVRAQDGGAARALELPILTACRTNEVIAATRREFDLTAEVWTVPADELRWARNIEYHCRRVRLRSSKRRTLFDRMILCFRARAMARRFLTWRCWSC